MLELDHIALACERLETGTAFAEETLGAPLAPGGQHAAMGTHNRLLSLGPELYFEVIAIDPDAPAPDRPRWFALDHFSGPPRLTNWILKTPDMAAALAQLPDGFGEVMHIARGDLRWQMAVPATGVLPWGGWAPALIQWEGDTHPAARLPDQGIRLKSLTLRHPQAVEMAELLAPLMPRDTALFEPAPTPGLRALFETPDGERTLE
ncbi:MAG: VOC family protein [Litoreibacter sp.]|nr:VOC family protein [Litoreibacter sp.]